jgi:dihydrofolate synthase/folylpolyglutamate synthase
MLTYREALLAIFQRADYERGDRPAYPDRVWRLSRVEELLSQIGDPHRAYPSAHIAGTKGKGSTTAMIESILRAAGCRTGMYTSPHLHTFRERIQLGGAPISEEQLAAQMERLIPVLATRPEVTVFEIITALAMREFADAGVDWGVFEVGMGGRLDATNVLLPEVAVITSISLDHVKVLGDTIAAIAGEKAGIIKADRPVVSAPQRPEAMAVIERVAAERGAPLTLVGRDWRWRYEGRDAARQWLTVWREGNARTPDYPRLEPALLGAHQLENASNAVAAVEVLRERGADIPREAVARGLQAVRWPGRLEVLGREPLVVVDGAHNVYSIQRLLEAVDDYWPHRRLTVVFGAGLTHNPGEMIEQLAPRASRLIVTRARHPKAAPVEELLSATGALGHIAQGCDTVAEALEAACAASALEDMVLVTGSLFVVAEAREAWAARHGWPPLPSDPPGVY